MDTNASGGGAPTWMPSGTGSLVKPLPSCTASVAVRRGGGAGCCGAGTTEDFTDCQAADSDALSCPGERCEDGMAITSSVAMVRRNRHRDREADNLLKQGAAPGEVAKHGRRLDRRHVPRLLHRLRDGLGEHFGIVAARRLAERLQGRTFGRRTSR